MPSWSVQHCTLGDTCLPLDSPCLCYGRLRHSAWAALGMRAEPMFGLRGCQPGNHAQGRERQARAGELQGAGTALLASFCWGSGGKGGGRGGRWGLQAQVAKRSAMCPWWFFEVFPSRCFSMRVLCAPGWRVRAEPPEPSDPQGS